MGCPFGYPMEVEDFSTPQKNWLLFLGVTMGGRPIEKNGDFFVGCFAGGKILWEETDTRSQVETMTMKPWEAGRHQIDRCEVDFNESLSILVHSCETVSEK